MRIILDTETSTIIVPDTFYQQVDKMNTLLEKAGTDAKLDYTKYVVDEFGKAAKNPFKRKSDVVRTRK